MRHTRSQHGMQETLRGHTVEVAAWEAGAVPAVTIEGDGDGEYLRGRHPDGTHGPREQFCNFTTRSGNG